MVNITPKAEEIFSLGGLPVTNALLHTFLVVLALTIVAFIFRKKLSRIPGTFQNIMEFAVESILNLMDSVLGSREKSEKYLPLIATIFLFILVSNWSGLLPGVGSLGLLEHDEFVPLLRAPASDLNFTLAIALVTVFTINILGILALGLRAHLSKFFNFKGPIEFYVGILELVSECAKVVSFSFRLFGNVFAGEVLLVIVGFLVPYVIPLPFLFLEIFVGFIQALVFAMLTLVFVAIATVEHEHAEAH